MSRIDQSEKTYKRLFGDKVPAMMDTDPELVEIYNRFAFGDTFHYGELDEKLRELVVLVVLATNQTVTQLREHVVAALRIGVSPVEIKEAMYQCAPYIGFPKTFDAVTAVNAVFAEQGIQLPLESQGKVAEEKRFDEGIKTRASIFGEGTYNNVNNAPDNMKHIQRYLCAACFGDFYTRGGLDIKTREILTLCMISALGGSESQVKSHIQANFNVGNEKEMLYAAITHCLPYMGFPRTLNALACLNG